jgi:thioredoxin-dependent peroxiredoxin
MRMRKLNLARTATGLIFLALNVVTVADEEPAVDLQVGDVAPTFQSTTDSGKSWKLSDHVGRKFVVVYFYPADFTTGCTKQAEAWRDNMNAVADAGVEVVGVSGDSVMNHELFKTAWKLNFTLLADEKAEVAGKFGVPVRRGGRVRPRGPDRQPLTDENGEPLLLERKATFARWTFVIGKDGNIVYKNIKVHPTKDSQQVLEFIKSLESPDATSQLDRSEPVDSELLCPGLSRLHELLGRESDA